MRDAERRLRELLDEGYPVRTSVIVAALEEMGTPLSSSSVVARFRRAQKTRVAALGREALWSPESVRKAFPEFARVEVQPEHYQ